MIEKNPFVSIIMPTYNRAGYIKETIECIIAQSYPHWELLIIDDGSTDGTEAIVSGIENNRITYHKFQRTGITGKLKNYGIRTAKGDLIAFMDSDDIWPADKLKKQVAALMEHPEAGFSFTNGFNFTIPYTPEVYFYNTLQGTVVENVFIKHCKTEIGIRTPTLLFRKSCIEKTGYFKETRLFTDYSFIGELSFHFQAVILYEPLFYRRLHGGNNFNTNSYEDYEEYFETINAFIKTGKLLHEDIRLAMYKSHIHAGDALVLNHKKKSLQHYLTAWKYCPFSFTPMKRIIKMYLRIYNN